MYSKTHGDRQRLQTRPRTSKGLRSVGAERSIAHVGSDDFHRWYAGLSRTPDPWRSQRSLPQIVPLS
jgi:hypothetical protein